MFLRGMEGFDANIASGLADMADLQNGKGDFFNDLIALLLENCAGVELFSRGKVPGLIIPNHNLDVTYPSSGTIKFLLEAKAVGTPKHPGSPKAKPMGRSGSADLDKRVKEIGFKTIDLKLEHSRIASSEGHSPNSMTGDLSAWLKQSDPQCYVFIAARVVGDKDLARVIRFADLAGLVSDAVGLFCFRPTSEKSPTTYQSMAVPPHLEIGRVLFRACQSLTALKDNRSD